MEEEVVYPDRQLLVLLPVHHREFKTSIVKKPLPPGGHMGKLHQIVSAHLQDKDPIGIIPLEDLCVRALQDAGKPVPAAK